MKQYYLVLHCKSWKKRKEISDFKGKWFKEQFNTSDVLFVLLFYSTLNPYPLNHVYNIFMCNYRKSFKCKAKSLATTMFSVSHNSVLTSSKLTCQLHRLWFLHSSNGCIITGLVTTECLSPPKFVCGFTPGCSCLLCLLSCFYTQLQKCACLQKRQFCCVDIGTPSQPDEEQKKGLVAGFKKI